MAAIIKQKVGTKNTIETYYPNLVTVPKSNEEIVATYYDDRKDDPVYDVAQLPSDWTQEIEDAYDAEEDQ